MPSGGGQSTDFDDDNTLTFCRGLLDQNGDPEAIARVARERNLTYDKFKGVFRDIEDPAIRNAMKVAFAKARPARAQPQSGVSVSLDEGAAKTVLSDFIESVKRSGTLSTEGRFDRDVIASVAQLTKGSPDVLKLLETKLLKTADEGEVRRWVGAVNRFLQGRSIKLISAAEMMSRPDPKFVIDGLIEERGFAVLYGPSGTGKTFIALDWCFSIAAGLPWLGRDVVSGPTVYVGAEGTGGLPKRLRSLVEYHDTDGSPPPDLYFIDQAVNLLDLGTVGEAIAAVRDLNVDPNLVVFDTYARSMVGGDENSAKDAGVAISNIDELRFALGTAVLVVHHPGKRGLDERGSGALRGAADTMLLLSGPTSSLRLDVDKQKNFDAGKSLLFRMREVGESLVPVESATTDGKPPREKGGDTENDKDEGIRQRILIELEAATKRGEAPIAQTPLVKKVGGNQARTTQLLHVLALADERVVMTESGKKKLYSLRTCSDSIPPTP
jgi:hypothetical protein